MWYHILIIDADACSISRLALLRKDMSTFSQGKVKLASVGRLYRLALCVCFRWLSDTHFILGSNSLYVPGLAERRPSVLIGDQVHLNPVNDDSITFVGIVHRIENLYVHLSLPRRFDPLKLYDVKFVGSKTIFRRMHQALDLTKLPSHGRIMYPSLEHVKPVPPLQLVDPFDERLRRNDHQWRAVSSIVSLPAESPPFVIFGP